MLLGDLLRSVGRSRNTSSARRSKKSRLDGTPDSVWGGSWVVALAFDTAYIMPSLTTENKQNKQKKGERYTDRSPGAKQYCGYSHCRSLKTQVCSIQSSNSSSNSIYVLCAQIKAPHPLLVLPHKQHHSQSLASEETDKTNNACKLTGAWWPPFHGLMFCWHQLQQTAQNAWQAPGAHNHKNIHRVAQKYTTHGSDFLIPLSFTYIRGERRQLGNEQDRKLATKGKHLVIKIGKCNILCQQQQHERARWSHLGTCPLLGLTINNTIILKADLLWELHDTVNIQGQKREYKEGYQSALLLGLKTCTAEELAWKLEGFHADLETCKKASYFAARRALQSHFVLL